MVDQLAEKVLGDGRSEERMVEGELRRMQQVWREQKKKRKQLWEPPS